MIKFDVTQEVQEYDGQPVMEKGKPVTWRNVIINALNTPTPGEVFTSEMKAKSYEVSVKVSQQKEPQLQVSQIAYILERIEKVYQSPLLFGKSKELLDPQEAEQTQSETATEEPKPEAATAETTETPEPQATQEQQA